MIFGNFCMKTCVCHQTMSVYCGQAAQKEELLNMELLIVNSDVATVVQRQCIGSATWSNIESQESIKMAANLTHVACVYLEHCVRLVNIIIFY